MYTPVEGDVYLTRLPRRLRRLSRAAADFLGCSRVAARRVSFNAITSRSGACFHFSGGA